MVPSLRQQRLTSLKIMPLEKRRIRGDLIETFKILKQMDKVDTSFFFSKATSRYATRGSNSLQSDSSTTGKYYPLMLSMPKLLTPSKTDQKIIGQN